MTKEHEPNSEPQQNAGPGAKLRQARIDRNLDQERIAEQLHLSKQQVEAIEQDDYTYVSALAYARGHLLLYAKLVDLSTHEILKAFDALGLKEKAAIAQTPLLRPGMIESMGSTSSAKWVRWGTTSLIVILLLIAVAGLINHYRKVMLVPTTASTATPDTTAATPTTSAPTATAPAPTTDAATNNNNILVKPQVNQTSTANTNAPAQPVVNVPATSSGPIPLPIPPASETQIPSNTPPVENQSQSPDSTPAPRGEDTRTE